MMEKFLQAVARDLKRKVRGDLSDVAVVFPNKRAALFFDNYLMADETDPLWSPTYMTIGELFREMRPGVTVPDSVELVCRLYRVYLQVVTENTHMSGGGGDSDKVIESLDYFYQWGETLISDFEDVDKNLADARKLFTHLSDWGELEADDFIDSDTEKKIKDFFVGFSVENMSRLRRRFLEMWERLYEIYVLFNDSLEADGLAYEGALYRKAVEEIRPEALSHTCYVFVGFNVLDKVEEELFRRLRQAGKALFYWDYDKTLMGGQSEAGMFLRRNMEEFPNELRGTSCCELGRKEISIVSSKTDSLQAHFAGQWIAENLTEVESDTAVVLCDERQLQPILHAIPSQVCFLNVTMGYPLGETPVTSFVDCLANLQNSYDRSRDCFSFDKVASLLKHPYARLLSTECAVLLRRLTQENVFYPTVGMLSCDAQGDVVEELAALFAPVADNLALCEYMKRMIQFVAQKYATQTNGVTGGSEGGDERGMYAQLYAESLFQAYTSVTRVANLVENGMLDVSNEMLLRLIEKMLQGITIPFHGEPAEGLQVMGMLETRNLDFKHIILVGANEGMLPKSVEMPSFIPYTIRRNFGMTTVERRVSVFAYYFYRLLIRSEKVCMLYNDEADGGRKGEMSRFLLQLLAEHPGGVRMGTIEPRMKLAHPLMLRPERSAAALTALRRRFANDMEDAPNEATWICEWIDNHAARKGKTADTKGITYRILSPSALNTYLDCRLKFYFKYVAGMKPKEDLSVEVDSAMFGTIFHNAAQEVYERLTQNGCAILGRDLENLRKFQDAKLGGRDERLFDVEEIVDFYFRREFFKQKELAGMSSCGEFSASGIRIPPVDYNGTQLVNKEVIVRLVLKLLDIDVALGDFDYLGAEVNVHRTVELTDGSGQPLRIILGGNIDRIDSVGFSAGKQVISDEEASVYKPGTIRIVDYKTGAYQGSSPQSMANIFDREESKYGYYLQTFLYASILCDLTQGKVPIVPSLLYIQKQNRNALPVLKMGGKPIFDFRELKPEFDALLGGLVSEVFASDGCYDQTCDKERCVYCDYRRLCRR